jgi:hypothetical protein
MESAQAASSDAAGMTEEAKVPDIYQTDASDSGSGASSPNQILKCRDASGGIQYTQNYCPPGTTRVDAPAN